MAMYLDGRRHVLGYLTGKRHDNYDDNIPLPFNVRTLSHSQNRLTYYKELNHMFPSAQAVFPLKVIQTNIVLNRLE